MFARIVTALINRVFGIPMISFFDDFGGDDPPELIDGDLRRFCEFCALPDIGLMAKKTEFWVISPPVGLMGEFPMPKNRSLL